jgi:hypothetical protein
MLNRMMLGLALLCSATGAFAEDPEPAALPPHMQPMAPGAVQPPPVEVTPARVETPCKQACRAARGQCNAACAQRGQRPNRPELRACALQCATARAACSAVCAE